MREEARNSDINIYKYIDYPYQNVLQISHLQISAPVKMDVQSIPPCQIALDRKFGPGIQCSQFDFTITFEQEIFGIIVSSIFLILITLRCWRVYGKKVITTSETILWVKAVSCLLSCMDFPDLRCYRLLQQLLFASS